MNWAASELASVDLGDKRLNKRVIKILESLGRAPKQSIPESCGTWGDTIAAYRFFMNDEVTWECLLEAHLESTKRRINESDSDILLCIQDTTELDFNGKQATGLGRLSYDKQRGMYLHPTFCVTPERISFGLTDAWMWARGTSKAEDQANPSISESTRWVEGYERVCEMASHFPDKRLVYVADREGDLWDVMAKGKALQHPADWLVRAKHNRKTQVDGKLWDAIAQQEAIACIHFVKPRSKQQASRKVEQAIRVLRTTLAQGGQNAVDVTLVEAREINPPEGVKPLVWRLLTNRTIDTAEQAIELIDWYLCRWEIEMFFDVLKVGCEVESMQLKDRERIEKALILYMIVAWRVMYLMRLGRQCPDLSAELFFEPLEWKITYGLNKMRIPEKVPCLNDVIRNLAKLGGFLARKSDGEPGTKKIWQGFQRMQDALYGVYMAQHIKGLMD